jgi:hypothetical protein
MIEDRDSADDNPGVFEHQSQIGAGRAHGHPA